MENTGEGIKIVTNNRKAYFNYEVLEKFEAGVSLLGTEIKSVRENKLNLNDSFCLARNGEVMMINSNISGYTFGNICNHEPTRPRKLLLHKYEIRKLTAKCKERGFSIIPLRAYLKRGKLKIEIGLCRGKKAVDKKEHLKERDLKRQFAKDIKGR
ncbi:MAG TPA: SsrA-binding protein SmpB [Candidatus Wallbacteria bacterium]|nr:SsrA-binding protein SmpB [Candidatus Wallbacteria bacterium]